MKCTIDRLELLSLLGKLEFVAKNKSHLPVLQMVLVKAERGKLTAWANDFDVILTGTVKAKVQSAGAICVPLSLISLLKSSKTKTVTLTTRGKDKVDVELGNISSTLDFTSAEEFPVCGMPVKGKKIVIEDLTHAIGQVSYAMSKEYDRPVLTGVCFNQHRRGLELVAADGFRLGLTKVKSRGGKLSGQVIIPKKTVMAIQKFAKGPVTIRVEDKLDSSGNVESRKLAFDTGDLVICSTTISGIFPDYDKLIPKTTKTLKVSTVALSEAVTTLSRLNLKDSAVKLKARKGTILVSGNVDGNETRIQVPGKGSAKIAFDPKLLLDVTRLLGKETVLQHTNSSSPGMFKYNGTIHLLMPRFVEW